MNENEFARTARAWLDDGPARMSDRAVLSALQEIHMTKQRRAMQPARRATPMSILGLGGPTVQRLSMAVPAGFAAIALFAIAAVLLSNVSRSTDNPAAASPTSSPSSSPSFGGMWPQRNQEEVRQAQDLADAGDPGYAWQVDTQLFTDADTWMTNGRGQSEIVGRFLREVQGWEAYELNPFEGMVRNGVYDAFYDQRYVRCAPGETNPLYPPGPEPEWGERCAPTLDDLRYEHVSVDLAQLVRQDRDGIFVVNGWRVLEPFRQADPVAVETTATERLEDFLAARVAGEGAEGYVQVDDDVELPLLYATSSGAPYERYEIERVGKPRWPYGNLALSARLFAEGGATVVEQQFSWTGHDPTDVLWLDVNSTTENGQPIALSYGSGDGEVTASTPSNWRAYWPGKPADGPAADVWFGLLWPDSPNLNSSENIGLVDPVAYDAWCAAHGGNPLLTAPADAAAIAEQLRADPDFETTAPVSTKVGGLEALSMDVAMGPGGEACGIGMIEIARWVHAIGWEPESRLRLYLVDLPEGMSVETLAITVEAPEDRFDAFTDETAPIIESIEFHAANAPSASP